MLTLENFCKGFFAILLIIFIVGVAVTPVGLAFLILWGICSNKNEPKEKLQNNIVRNVYWSSCSNSVKEKKKITMYNDKGYSFKIVI